MASDLFNGEFPFPVNFTTLAIALALLLAGIALVRGVIGMFVGMVCLAAGALVAWSCHGYLPGLISQISSDPSPRFVFLVAVGIGFSVYVALRLLAGALLLSPLRRKGEKRLLGGPIGAALSLVPTAFLVFVLGIGLRMAGTLFSVQHTDAEVAREEGEEGEKRPFWARWNEALDRDYLGSLIARLDPIAVRTKAALSNLLVVLKDEAAGDKLARDAEAAPVLRNPAVRQLADDPEVEALVARGDYLTLLEHPRVKQVAGDPEVGRLLADLSVERLVDNSLYTVDEGGLLRRSAKRMRAWRDR